MSNISRITFVWNADFSLASGIRALKEAATGHHSCTLCGIAYHRVRQTRDWTAYKLELAERLDAEMREPCRDQLKQVERLAAKNDFPTVLAHTGKGVIKLLAAKDIDQCDGDIAAFRQKLDAAIAKVIG